MIIKKFDKKQLIAILRALQDNYIHIIYQDKTNEVIVRDTKTSITIQSK